MTTFLKGNVQTNFKNMLHKHSISANSNDWIVLILYKNMAEKIPIQKFMHAKNHLNGTYL
jgi:hypothetical protein